jgi:hypothetical protein
VESREQTAEDKIVIANTTLEQATENEEINKVFAMKSTIINEDEYNSGFKEVRRKEKKRKNNRSESSSSGERTKEISMGINAYYKQKAPKVVKDEKREKELMESAKRWLEKKRQEDLEDGLTEDLKEDLYSERSGAYDDDFVLEDENMKRKRLEGEKRAAQALKKLMQATSDIDVKELVGEHTKDENNV